MGDRLRQRRVVEIAMNLLEDWDSPKILLRLSLLPDTQLAYDVAKAILIFVGSKKFIDQYGELRITRDRKEYEDCRQGKLERHVDSVIFQDGPGEDANLEGLDAMIKYVHEGNPTRQYYEKNRTRYEKNSSLGS